MPPDPSPARRPCGPFTVAQRTFIAVVLEGAANLAEAARAAGVAYSTAKQWSMLAHPVRQEIERLRATRAKIVAAIEQSMTSPKSTPWQRFSAAEKLAQLTGLDQAGTAQGAIQTARQRAAPATDPHFAKVAHAAAARMRQRLGIVAPDEPAGGPGGA